RSRRAARRAGGVRLPRPRRAVSVRRGVRPAGSESRAGAGWLTLSKGVGSSPSVHPNDLHRIRAPRTVVIRITLRQNDPVTGLHHTLGLQQGNGGVADLGG